MKIEMQNPNPGVRNRDFLYFGQDKKSRKLKNLSHKKS